MAEHYVRLAGLDIDSSILEYYGLPPKREEKDQTLKPKICPGCQSINEPNAIACDKCGMLLDERYALPTIGIPIFNLHLIPTRLPQSTFLRVTS